MESQLVSGTTLTLSRYYVIMLSIWLVFSFNHILTRLFCNETDGFSQFLCKFGQTTRYLLVGVALGVLVLSVSYVYCRLLSVRLGSRSHTSWKTFKGAIVIVKPLFTYSIVCVAGLGKRVPSKHLWIRRHAFSVPIWFSNSDHLCHSTHIRWDGDRRDHILLLYSDFNEDLSILIKVIKTIKKRKNERHTFSSLSSSEVIPIYNSGWIICSSRCTRYHVQPYLLTLTLL
jgi:hypothetical protein